MNDLCGSDSICYSLYSRERGMRWNNAQLRRKELPCLRIMFKFTLWGWEGTEQSQSSVSVRSTKVCWHILLLCSWCACSQCLAMPEHASLWYIMSPNYLSWARTQDPVEERVEAQTCGGSWFTRNIFKKCTESKDKYILTMSINLCFSNASRPKLTLKHTHTHRCKYMRAQTQEYYIQYS